MKKILLVTFVLVTSLCSVYAQESDALMKSRLDSLEQSIISLNKVMNAKSTSSNTPIVFSGNIFANYSYSVTGVDYPSTNKFDLDRTYLTAKSQLSDEWKVQVTSDIYRTSTISSTSFYNGLALRLKFSYLDYNPLSTLSIKFGMIPTVWTGFSETFWKYRGIAKVPTDLNKYFSTADLGVSATYSLPNKLGEVAAYILNGNGYDYPDTNRFKDVGLRVNITPFSSSDPWLKSLVLGAYTYMGYNGKPGGIGLERNRFGGIVGYSYSFVSVNAEYDVRNDAALTNPYAITTGSLCSVFGELRSPFEGELNKLALVWRVDFVSPNVYNSKTNSQFLIAGVAYKATKDVTLAIDDQWTYANISGQILKDYNKNYIQYDAHWYLHTMVNF